jgi:hypothetical protein
VARVMQFAEWLSATPLSLAIQTHDWVIPTVQSVHIVAIGIVLASVFMIDLRILGLASLDQTLTQTTRRFGPWLSGALWVLLVTGLLMVVGEPARELLAFSFWFKMCLVAIGTAIAVVFRMSLDKHAERWEHGLVNRVGIRTLAIVTLLVWIGVVFLGRLIAYDHVWGSWSLSPKA